MKNRKHIKLFESKYDSSYVETIDSDVYGRVDLYNRPKTTSKGENIGEDSEIVLNKIVITFDLNVQYKRSGIDGIMFILKSVAVEGAVLDFESEERDSFDIIDDDITHEKYDEEMGELPLYIDTVVIDMNNTFDTSKWEYNIQIGHFD
jgi:hypothetical protein